MVDGFSAVPTVITVGESATLTWTTSNAVSVSIDNGVGAGLPADGSSTVSPTATTTVSWTLKAQKAGVTNLAVTATDGATGTEFSGAASIEIIK